MCTISVQYITVIYKVSDLIILQNLLFVFQCPACSIFQVKGPNTCIHLSFTDTNCWNTALRSAASSFSWWTCLTTMLLRQICKTVDLRQVFSLLNSLKLISSSAEATGITKSGLEFKPHQTNLWPKEALFLGYLQLVIWDKHWYLDQQILFVMIWVAYWQMRTLSGYRGQITAL